MYTKKIVFGVRSDRGFIDLVRGESWGMEVLGYPDYTGAFRQASQRPLYSGTL